MLFVRMGIMLVVALYTSRIVLQQLGIADFGIYNVVAGIVMLMGFFNGSLAQGVQRFLNYYLAQGDFKALNQVYSASVVIAVLLAVIVFILGETLGIWFLNNYMNIPHDRVIAANFVFQFALILIVSSIFQIPHIGLLMAHENMGTYAVISISYSILQCICAYCLSFYEYDKLILYSVITAGVTIIISIVYKIYCNLKYPEARFQLHKQTAIYRELLTFSGWNILGNSAYAINLQGINIILNIFFGPSMNAARAIAMQIGTKIDELSGNVQMASNPQIVHHYAKGEFEALQSLMMNNFKWNFYLLWIIGLPLFLELDYVLEAWLGIVPQSTLLFTSIIISRCLIKSFEKPLVSTIFATGRTKYMMIGVSITIFIELLIVYLVLYLGAEAYWAFFLEAGAVFVYVIFYMIYLRIIGLFSFQRFMKQVLFPLLLISILSLPFTYLVYQFPGRSFCHLILTCLTSDIITCTCIFFIGLNKLERQQVISKIRGYAK